MKFWALIKKLLGNQRGNLQKMFTLPKSKSPWEAMTAGSTGGWAKGIQPWGPVINAGLGMIPGVGPLLSTGAGMLGMSGMGGFQGTDYGWGKGILDTIGGGLSGYGLGALGSGVKGAVTGGEGLMKGFQSGMNKFLGTNIIPGVQGSSGSSIWSGTKNLLGMGGGGTGFGGGAGGPAVGGGAGKEILKSSLNWGNLAPIVLGGGSILGSTMMRPPTVKTSPEAALNAVNMPDLVDARNMIKTMAMANPDEFANSKELDDFMNRTIEQSNKAYQNQRRIIENNLATKGKTLNASGGGSQIMADFDKNYQEGIQKFVADTKWSAYVAGINQQVQAVMKYYDVSEQQAAEALAAYGYITPEDLMNYNAELQGYLGAQQSLGRIGGMLLAPKY